MKSKESNNVLDDIELKEELKKTKNKFKDTKTKEKKIKKEKKQTKKEKVNKSPKKRRTKSKKKKRKLNKVNILIILFSLIFLITAIITFLYGIGVLKFSLKDPGPKYYNLSDKVNVGDYVDYDAGYWNEEKEVPNEWSQFTFGGYKIDTSRNNGVNCNYNAEENKGWRVFSIEEDKVTLIQSGISMCYYHGYGNLSNDTSLNILSNLDETNNYNGFLDDEFSESVKILSKEDIDKYTGTDSSYQRIRESLINVGIPYWLASKDKEYYMWYVTEGGTVATDHVGTYGVRVLITLKKNVKTTGFDKEGIWKLVNKTKKGE